MTRAISGLESVGAVASSRTSKRKPGTRSLYSLAGPPETPRRPGPFGSHRRGSARARTPRWKEGYCGFHLRRPGRESVRRPRVRRAGCRRTSTNRPARAKSCRPLSLSRTPRPCRWHLSTHAISCCGAAKGGPKETDGAGATIHRRWKLYIGAAFRGDRREQLVRARRAGLIPLDRRLQPGDALMPRSWTVAARPPRIHASSPQT